MNDPVNWLILGILLGMLISVLSVIIVGCIMHEISKK